MIHLVIKEVGEYEDYRMVPVAAFTGLDAAESYVDKINRQYNVIQEIAKNLDGWYAQYDRDNAPVREHLEKPPISPEDAEILATRSDGLKDARKAIQSKRVAILDDWRKTKNALEDAYQSLYKDYMANRLAARNVYISDLFSQVMQDNDITVALIDLYTYGDRPAWSVRPISLDGN